ncbi:MAG: hypothetical protein WBM07_11295 [Chitinivibrionales bacterium]
MNFPKILIFEKHFFSLKNHCTIVYMKICFLLFLLFAAAMNPSYAAEPFNGFQNALWGSKPDDVKKSNNLQGWTAVPPGNEFPKELNITMFRAAQNIAGKAASVKYYFQDGKFFQATVRFNFDNLKTFDFNYNVYRSVDSYYRAIHDQTLTFVFDVFDLLRKKYGKREPAFKGVDPRFIFKNSDEYLKRESWNLRSYPYDYYKKIVATAYAQWDLPTTRIIFSIAISAPEKQFDYELSLSSNDLAAMINAKKDSLRIQNL